jgi:hypothetical protein
MKITLILLLSLIALVMIYLGVKAEMVPPILTGVGFIVIAALFLIGAKK